MSGEAYCRTANRSDFSSSASPSALLSFSARLRSLLVGRRRAASVRFCSLGSAAGNGMQGANPTAVASTGFMRLGSFDTAVTTTQQTVATTVGSQSRLPHTIRSRANMVTSSARASPPKKLSMIKALTTCVRLARYSLSVASYCARNSPRLSKSTGGGKAFSSWVRWASRLRPAQL